MRVVIDANILVSAYTADGVVREYWQHRLELIECVISPEIMIEVERTLRQSEFQLHDLTIREFLLDILDRCTLVRPRPPRDLEFSNSKDSHIAAMVLSERPDAVLTGDRGLLDLKEVHGCPITTLKNFCETATAKALR